MSNYCYDPCLPLPVNVHNCHEDSNTSSLVANMNSFQLFLLLGALALCSGSNANEYAALLDDLFEDEDYDPRAIPLEKPPQSSSDNSNAINVGVGLNILDLLLNQEYGTLASNAWLMLKWNDFRLMWDPDQYDGLKSIRVPNDIIWKPDIALYNLVT